MDAEAREVYEEIRALEREALEKVNEALDDADADADASREDALTRAKACALRVRALIEELREMGDDAESEEARRAIASAVSEREVALENTRAIMRHAVIEAASKGRAREARERDALLTGQSGTNRHDAIKASGAVSIASEATEGLRRARQMMATELEKGEKTLAAMTESTATMERTGTEYSNQTTKLKSGRRLLTTIERQTFMDRVILWFGFSVFLLVVIHILWKRTPVLARFHPLYYKRSLKTSAMAPVSGHSLEKSTPEFNIPSHSSHGAASGESSVGGEQDDPYRIGGETRRDNGEL